MEKSIADKSIPSRQRISFRSTGMNKTHNDVSDILVSPNQGIQESVITSRHADLFNERQRQHRSDSGAIPRSFATATIAFAPGEYRERDSSAGSLTAFSLNSPVYLAPFAMVPSPPIELKEMQNKKSVHIIWYCILKRINQFFHIGTLS
jgi:hypothetical protein